MDNIHIYACTVNIYHQKKKNSKSLHNIGITFSLAVELWAV